MEKDFNKLIDTSIEKTLLAFFISNITARSYIYTCSEQYFSVIRHGEIFIAIKKAYSSNSEFTLLELLNIADKYREYLILLSNIFISCHVKRTIEYLRGLYIRRMTLKILRKAEAFLLTPSNNYLQIIQRIQMRILELNNWENTSEYKDAFVQYYADTLQSNMLLNSNKKLNTGYAELDQLIGGFKRGSLIFVAARPAMGKTSFMVNLLSNMRKSNKKCLFLSAEEDPAQIVDKLVRCESGYVVDSAQQLPRSSILELKQYLRDIKTAGNISIVEAAGHTIEEIKIHVLHKKNNGGLHVVFIDYIQLLKTNSHLSNRNLQIGDLSTSLKVLAKELGIIIIAASQLSRASEKREGNIPMLSDLRDSGNLEQDADAVLLLYREEYYLMANRPADNSPDYSAWSFKMAEAYNKLDVIVAKNRYGQVGKAVLDYNRSLCRIRTIL